MFYSDLFVAAKQNSPFCMSLSVRCLQQYDLQATDRMYSVGCTLFVQLACQLQMTSPCVVGRVLGLNVSCVALVISAADLIQLVFPGSVGVYSVHGCCITMQEASPTSAVGVQSHKSDLQSAGMLASRALTFV